MDSNEMLWYVAKWCIPIQTGVVISLWAWGTKRQIKKPVEKRIRMDFGDTLMWALWPALIPTIPVLLTAPWWIARIHPQAQAVFLCLPYPIFILIIGFIRWRRIM